MDNVPLPTAARSALLVIDMQNGFLSSSGSCARIGLPVTRLAGALQPCLRAVAAARHAGVPIVFTRYTFRSDLSDCGYAVREKFPGLIDAGGLIAGSHDHALTDEFRAHANDFVVDKNRPSAFHGTALESYLRGKAVTDVIICGVTTNCCVETTARDASQRDYRTFILRDAVAEYDEDRHTHALKALELLFAHLTTTADIERVFAGG